MDLPQHSKAIMLQTRRDLLKATGLGLLTSSLPYSLSEVLPAASSGSLNPVPTPALSAHKSLVRIEQRCWALGRGLVDPFGGIQPHEQVIVVALLNGALRDASQLSPTARHAASILRKVHDPFTETDSWQATLWHVPLHAPLREHLNSRSHKGRACDIKTIEQIENCGFAIGNGLIAAQCVDTRLAIAWRLAFDYEHLKTTAMADVEYVHPVYRGFVVGLGLVRYEDRQPSDALIRTRTRDGFVEQVTVGTVPADTGMLRLRSTWERITEDRSWLYTSNDSGSCVRFCGTSAAVQDESRDGQHLAAGLRIGSGEFDGGLQDFRSRPGDLLAARKLCRDLNPGGILI